MREKIIAVLAEAMKGSKKIKIVFKKEAVLDVPYLLGMVTKGIVRVEETARVLLYCIATSRIWGDDSNRTYEIELTETFDIDWFVQRMLRPLESIEVVALENTKSD